MIPITPAIIGLGIKEEYDDALQAITDLRAGLGARPLTNTTPDGRLLLEVAAIEQTIRARRLPIPVDASYAHTIYHLAGSHELGQAPGLVDSAAAEAALGRLYLVLRGYGLIKPRHIPVLIAMIDDLLAEIAPIRGTLTPHEHILVDQLAGDGHALRQGRWPSRRPPKDQIPGLNTPNLRASISNFGNKARRISLSLFDGWRPYPASKPSMTAPIPGLPAQAPPLPAGTSVP